MSTSFDSSASRNAYGATLLLLAAASIIPGVGMVTGPLAGSASLVLGVQLAWGKQQPWVPLWLKTRMASAAVGPRLSVWIHERCKPILHLTPPRFPLFLAGATVAWSSLLLVLPLVFIPFSNVIPSLTVGLVGAGLVAQKSILGWLGLVLSGGFTFALVLVGEALLLSIQALIHHLT
jgi:hypothetical protein